MIEGILPESIPYEIENEEEIKEKKESEKKEEDYYGRQ
jgi:hypothetical protein